MDISSSKLQNFGRVREREEREREREEHENGEGGRKEEGDETKRLGRME